MNVMQAAVRQMHEERLDRPDDEREDGTPSGPERSWNPEDSSALSGENVPEAFGGQEPNDPSLLAHASREALRRKGDWPAGPKASAGLHSFIDKQKPRSAVAAGPNGYPSGEPSDESLFLLYQQGDDHAFFSIYERYKSSIYAYCAHVLFSAGLSRELVEDTFQDVFLRLVQYRNTFTGGDFKPWIFTITRHSCLSAKKRTFRQHEGVEYAGDGVNFDGGVAEEVRQAFSASDDPLERMAKDEQIGLLLAAIAKLPDEFREALILSEYEEYTYEEIGRMTGTSLSTIRIRVFRAKARLRKMLLPVLEDDNRTNASEQLSKKKI